MKQLTTQQKMDMLLEELKEKGETPTLFLHSCCAPCSSYVLEYLSEYFEIVDFFYNPNISPKEEYEERLNELRRLIEKQPHKNRVTLVEGNYDPERFFEIAKGLEDIPEGGERCKKCFELRLTEAVKEAVKYNADYVTTSLTISPLKNAEVLNEIGTIAVEKINAATACLSAPPNSAAEETHKECKKKPLTWLSSDFKKKGGYKRSTELSKEYDLYRQNYCGCVFSKRDAIKRGQHTDIPHEEGDKVNSNNE